MLQILAGIAVLIIAALLFLHHSNQKKKVVEPQYTKQANFKAKCSPRESEPDEEPIPSPKHTNAVKASLHQTAATTTSRANTNANAVQAPSMPCPTTQAKSNPTTTTPPTTTTCPTTTSPITTTTTTCPTTTSPITTTTMNHTAHVSPLISSTNSSTTNSPLLVVTDDDDNTKTFSSTPPVDDKDDTQAAETSSTPQDSSNNGARKRFDKAALLARRESANSSTAQTLNDVKLLLTKQSQHVRAPPSSTSTSTSKARKHHSLPSPDDQKFSRLRAMSCPDANPLSVSANRWVPNLKGPQDALENSKKQVKGMLNKLTPENFETLCEKLRGVDTCDGELAGEVAQLLLETAVVHPLHGPTYAQLALVLAKEWLSEDHGKSFRAQLLIKCQSFFVDRSSNDGEGNESMHRRKVVNTVRFIGALFCHQVVPASIPTMCIRELLEGSFASCDEQEIEALCGLLATVGSKLENDGHSVFINDTMARIRKLSGQNLHSRLKFLLLDVLELRDNNWRPRRKQDAPQKLDTLRKEMERAAYHPSLRSAREPVNRTRPTRARTVSGCDDFLPPPLPLKTDPISRRADFNNNNIRPPAPVRSRSQLNTNISPPTSLPSSPSLGGSSPTPAMPSPSTFSFRHSAPLGPIMADPSTLPSLRLSSSNDLKSGFSAPQRKSYAGEDDSPSLIPITSPCATPPMSPTRLTPRDRVENLLKMFFLTSSQQHVVSEMRSDTMLRNSIEEFITKGISLSFDKSSTERKNFLGLMQHLHESALCSPTNVANAVRIAISDLDDLALDVPHAPQHAAVYLSGCLLTSLITAEDLISYLQPLHERSESICNILSDAVITSIKAEKGHDGVSQLLGILEASSLLQPNSTS